MTPPPTVTDAVWIVEGDAVLSSEAVDAIAKLLLDAEQHSAEVTT